MNHSEQCNQGLFLLRKTNIKKALTAIAVIKISKIKFFLILILAYVSCQSLASLIIEVPLDEEIKEAVLIIKGKMIKKYSKIEDIKHYYYDRNRDIKESKVKGIMYTTFVFSIDEILYGSYKNYTIEVKMRGGCYKSGICEENSTNFSYEKDENAVIFLKKIFGNEQYYMSTAGSYSAFTIDESNKINRKYHQSYGNKIKQNYIFMNSKGQFQTKEIITIDELKAVIDEVKSAREK